MPPWTIKTCTGTGGSLTREVPVCVAGEPVKAVMVCCKLAAPLTISGISINDSNYSLSKYLQHRAKWRSLSPGQQLPQTLSATRLGPGNQANCRTSDKVACCKLPIEIVNDKRTLSCVTNRFVVSNRNDLQLRGMFVGWMWIGHSKLSKISPGRLVRAELGLMARDQPRPSQRELQEFSRHS